jgi:hypothetical protein
MFMTSTFDAMAEPWVMASFSRIRSSPNRRFPWPILPSTALRCHWSSISCRFCSASNWGLFLGPHRPSKLSIRSPRLNPSLAVPVSLTVSTRSDHLNLTV